VHDQAEPLAPSRSAVRRPRHFRLASLIAVSLLSVALVAPAATSAASPTSTTTEATCAGRWPSSVQGAPTLLRSGGRAGDYIWHNSTGWHLRVTHTTSSRMVFSGRITATAPLKVTPYQLEGGDWIALSADRLTITYRFYNYGHLDGLDFTTACARRVTFSGYVNGTKLPTSRLWIGRDNRHPLQNPFAVLRIS